MQCFAVTDSSRSATRAWEHAKLQAFDPVAADTARRVFGVTFRERQDDSGEGAAAMLVVTEGNEFRHPATASVGA